MLVPRRSRLHNPKEQSSKSSLQDTIHQTEIIGEPDKKAFLGDNDIELLACLIALRIFEDPKFIAELDDRALQQ
jgi:hypothetical protein